MGSDGMTTAGTLIEALQAALDTADSNPLGWPHDEYVRAILWSLPPEQRRFAMALSSNIEAEDLENACLWGIVDQQDHPLHVVPAIREIDGKPTAVLSVQRDGGVMLAHHNRDLVTRLLETGTATDGIGERCVFVLDPVVEQHRDRYAIAPVGPDAWSRRRAMDVHAVTRIPCLACGDIIRAKPDAETTCRCGQTVVEGDWAGNAMLIGGTPITGSGLYEWDIWAEDHDSGLLVVGQTGVGIAMRRAELAGRPIQAVLALRSIPATDDEQDDDGRGYHGIEPTVIACADCESDRWPDAPTAEHLRQILAWGRRHQGQRVIVHCRQGLGRAPAAALAILADRLGPGQEPEAVEAMFALRPCAILNLHMTGLADELLGRDGALHEVARSHPLIRARHYARQISEGWSRFPHLLLPSGGGTILTSWEGRR
ncbi:hypothetical protein [Azospirillum cavernae]|nr:hypothetical protein [Azospirillum cavernae]